MTKLISSNVSERIKLTKKQTELIVNTLFTSITDASPRRQSGTARFGSFRVRQRHSRMAETPRQVRASIFPKESPFFKAGKELREMVDN
jgi:nucleoid DNA-binding protein